MKLMKKIFNICLVFSVLVFTSCADDITDINVNPNGVDPNIVHPNLLLSSVMSSTGKMIISDSYTSGVGTIMQHTQRDSWSDNNYGSLGAGNFDGYYGTLRNAELAYQRAVKINSEFYMGVSMILKAQLFGMAADFYGDVPYSEALKGGLEVDPILKPAYDSQEMVYKGVITDLLAAADILNKGNSYYTDANAQQDLYFDGQAEKWVRFANSLALRYYMRFSEKDNAFAKAGVEAMLSKDLIVSVGQECSLDFIGVSGDDSWPNNEVNNSRSSFARIKPCATLTNKLKELADPRISEWFTTVEVPIMVVPAGDPLLEGLDDNLNADGTRYISDVRVTEINGKIYDPITWYNDRAIDDKVMIDTSADYVGLPPSNQATDPFTYNLNPVPERGGENRHVSYLHSQFGQPSGDNLRVRILPASEVHFIMAEAAQRGWSVNGSAQAHFNMGIQASFDEWNIGDASSYIDGLPLFDDSNLVQIMDQKWIAGFASAHEAYFDWRRTSLPSIQTGPSAKSDEIPVRAIYSDSDKNINYDNYSAAVANLSNTSHTDDVPGNDGDDSSWSEPWIVQGHSPWND
jgi:hypothetical protein